MKAILAAGAIGLAITASVGVTDRADATLLVPYCTDPEARETEDCIEPEFPVLPTGGAPIEDGEASADGELEEPKA